MYVLVDLKSCDTRVLNWAILKNIRPVELAQKVIFLYLTGSTGHIFFHIAQFMTLA